MIAPILIPTYNRIEHLSKTIESLKSGNLARLSDLYIFIDGPKKSTDLQNNNLIYQYCLTISGFKSVNIINRKYNYGPHKNCIEAFKYIFAKYDSVIFIEDDNICSKLFLNYVNDGLIRYKYQMNIFAICGYIEPIDIEIDNYDVFIRDGFMSYGYGVWKNRFENIDFDTKKIKPSLKNLKQFLNLVNNFGYNVAAGLVYCHRKNKIFGDYMICLYMYLNKMKTVSPSVTLVRNIGQDGSGVNSGKNEFLQNQVLSNYSLNLNLEFDDNNSIIKSNLIKNYHKRPFYLSLIRYLQLLYFK